MNNDTKKSSEIVLPDSRNLVKSTIAAFMVALALLIVAVLPSEYGVDPTGIGRLMGLADMGKIKVQLAEEAAAESSDQNSLLSGEDVVLRLQRIEQRLDEIALVLADGGTIGLNRQGILKKQKTMETSSTAESSEKIKAAWKDQVSVILAPGQGVEFKLVMDKDAKAWFEWTANGSKLNFDSHGNGDGRSVQYKNGRGVTQDEGVLEAAFDGDHGWFWRNRTNKEVTLTLKTKGEYTKLKRTA